TRRIGSSSSISSPLSAFATLTAYLYSPGLPAVKGPITPIWSTVLPGSSMAIVGSCGTTFEAFSVVIEKRIRLNGPKTNAQRTNETFECGQDTNQVTGSPVFTTAGSGFITHVLSSYLIEIFITNRRSILFAKNIGPRSIRPSESFRFQLP